MFDMTVANSPDEDENRVVPPVDVPRGRRVGRIQVHLKPLSFQTCKFHPKPLSSQHHFHPKTTFIPNHIFIQNHMFIQNHFHPMCLGERGGGVLVSVCVSLGLCWSVCVCLWVCVWGGGGGGWDESGFGRGREGWGTEEWGPEGEGGGPKYCGAPKGGGPRPRKLGPRKWGPEGGGGNPRVGHRRRRLTLRLRCGLDL